MSTAASPRVGMYDGRRLAPSSLSSLLLLKAVTAALEASAFVSSSKRGRGLLLLLPDCVDPPCKKAKTRGVWHEYTYKEGPYAPKFI